MVTFPTDRRIAALHPAVEAFPELRCFVYQDPTGYWADGGCRG